MSPLEIAIAALTEIEDADDTVVSCPAIAFKAMLDIRHELALFGEKEKQNA